MKITKYVHSCLLVEEQNTTVLIDPGQYTFDEKALDINSLPKLDYILITHEHFDHMCTPFIKELVVKFPSVKIISNTSVQETLQKARITVGNQVDENVTFEDAPHERILGETPQNISFNVFNTLTHPGDSLRFSLRTPVLALPITAPWGSMIQAIELTAELKPKIVIPIHDWHWRDDARRGMYEWGGGYLKGLGIDFKAVETGETIEV